MSSTGFIRSFRAKAVVGCSFAIVLFASAIVKGYAAVNRSSSLMAFHMSARHVNRTNSALVGEGVPINLGLPTLLPQAGGFYITVTLNSVPSSGTTVKVDVSDRTHIAPPSGNWPYTITFAPNSSSTATIWVTTSGTPSGSSASAVSCKGDSDITNPANWTATASSFWDAPVDPPGGGGFVGLTAAQK